MHLPFSGFQNDIAALELHSIQASSNEVDISTGFELSGYSESEIITRIKSMGDLTHTDLIVEHDCDREPKSKGIPRTLEDRPCLIVENLAAPLAPVALKDALMPTVGYHLPAITIRTNGTPLPSDLSHYPETSSFGWDDRKVPTMYINLLGPLHLISNLGGLILSTMNLILRILIYPFSGFEIQISASWQSRTVFQFVPKTESWLSTIIIGVFT
jgi:hypothetical protein